MPCFGGGGCHLAANGFVTLDGIEFEFDVLRL
jgi:hypothetical protein